MIVIPIDRLSEDGKRIPNNLAQIPVTHARLYYDTFANSDYVQGVLVDETCSFEFDVSELTASDLTAVKLFTSTDGTNYTEDESYGGTEGAPLPPTVTGIDTDDFAEGDLIIKQGNGFVGTTLSAQMAAEGIDQGGVDYFFVRGILCQENTIDSGKAYFGSVALDVGTGILSQSLINPEVTIATSFYKTGSSKVSTGIYRLQFRVGTTNGFITGLEGSQNSYKFESLVYPIYNKLTVTEIDPGVEWEAVRTCEKIGDLILDVSSDDGIADFASGILRIETRNTAGTLTDGLLKGGLTVEFKAFNNLGN